MNQHDDPSSTSQRTRRALILSGLASAMGVSLPALAQTTPAAKQWSAIEAAGAELRYLPHDGGPRGHSSSGDLQAQQRSGVLDE